MKILAVSDNVLPQMESASYLKREYADVSLIISCGDLPAAYLEMISSTLNMPLFFVRGNHDTQYTADQPGGDNLHGRFIKFGGLTFAGLEGSPRYNNEPIQYSNTQMFWMMLGLARILLPRRLRFGYGVDVMVTHAPPRGIHDMPDRAHQGFPSLRTMLRLYRPRYMIHGHVDTWDRRRTMQTRFAQTDIININPSKLLNLNPSERRS